MTNHKQYKSDFPSCMFSITEFILNVLIGNGTVIM